MTTVLYSRKKIDAALSEPNLEENQQQIGDLILIVGEFHDLINSVAGKLNNYFAVVVSLVASQSTTTSAHSSGY